MTFSVLVCMFYGSSIAFSFKKTRTLILSVLLLKTTFTFSPASFRFKGLFIRGNCNCNFISQPMGSVEYVHMVIASIIINPMHPLVTINKSLSQSHIANNPLTLVNALPFRYVYLLLEWNRIFKDTSSIYFSKAECGICPC